MLKKKILLNIFYCSFCLQVFVDLLNLQDGAARSDVSTRGLIDSESPRFISSPKWFKISTVPRVPPFQAGVMTCELLKATRTHAHTERHFHHCVEFTAVPQNATHTRDVPTSAAPNVSLAAFSKWEWIKVWRALFKLGRTKSPLGGKVGPLHPLTSAALSFPPDLPSAGENKIKECHLQEIRARSADGWNNRCHLCCLIDGEV